MSRQPPIYKLDPETRTLARIVVEFAEQLAEIQHNPGSRDEILDTASELRYRLGLEPSSPEPRLCEVVPLRPFRVIREQ